MPLVSSVWLRMALGRSVNSSPSKSNRGPVRDWVPWQYRARPQTVLVTATVIGTLLAIGLLVMSRRLTGALTTDLQPMVMLFMALGVSSALATARVAWRRSFPLETFGEFNLSDRFVGWGSSAALALLAVGCCYPAYRTADWMIWLPLLIADQFWRQHFFDGGKPWLMAGDSQSVVEQPAEDAPLSAPWTPEKATAALRCDGQASNEDAIVQQLYRLQESGCDVIYGTVRADFAAGQRTAVLHVGFCPPLAYLPSIEAEALPGPAAKLKVVQALAHGTRLDVRLLAPAEGDCQVWIDMAARPISA